MANTVAWDSGSWSIPVRVKTLTELFREYSVANTCFIPGWSDDFYSVLGTTIYVQSHLCPVTYGYDTYVNSSGGVSVLVPAKFFTNNLVIDSVAVTGNLTANSSLIVSNGNNVDLTVNVSNAATLSPIIPESSPGKNNSGKLNINYDDKIPTLRQDM